MSERNQYHLRLAISLCLGACFAVTIERCSGSILGQRTWSDFWITHLRMFLVVLLTIPICFLTHRSLYRHEQLFTEKGFHSKPWLILILGVIVGQHLFEEIRISHGLNEIWVRSAMVILGCAIGGLIFWLGFGRWYSAKIAGRKASLAAQATVGELT